VVPDVSEPLYGVLGRLKGVLVVARMGRQVRQVEKQGTVAWIVTLDDRYSFVRKEVCRVVAPGVLRHLQVTSHVIPLVGKKLQEKVCSLTVLRTTVRPAGIEPVKWVL
jgi:hypothetical protein